jgi:hypothetical protein
VLLEYVLVVLDEDHVGDGETEDENAAENGKTVLSLFLDSLNESLSISYSSLFDGFWLLISSSFFFVIFFLVGDLSLEVSL